MSDDSPNQLHVYFETEQVGTISTDDGVKIQFEYSRSWVEKANSFPISTSMPLPNSSSLNANEIDQNVAHNFFVNLLPEEVIRDATCRKLGISNGNDFELLRRIGGDCAGAFAILHSDEKPRDSGYEYEPISSTKLAEWCVGDVLPFADVAGENSIRLSLAGAQSKLPVMFDGTSFFLGKHSAPSTHILKFPGRFSHLPENEVFTTKLADSVGLTTVNLGLQTVELSKRKQTRVAVIERYDRIKGENHYVRLHQEDFCQALGLHPQKKYEQEGGPTLGDCARLIRSYCSIPAIELEKFVRWVVFNWLSHNADAHGKNISFLFTQEGRTVLAPFYDLVCTRNYPNLNKNLAMKLGGEASPGAVQHVHLQKFAEEIEMSPKFVTEVSIESASKLLENLDNEVSKFEKEFGASPVLQRIPSIVRRRCSRALEILRG